MTRSLPPLQRLLLVGLIIIFAVSAIGQIRVVANREGAFYAGGEIPVGADFLVFYSAGRIVAAGDGGQLYEPSRQLSEQVEILGRDRGLAIFPYPAFVAAPYAALARFSLPTAYWVATLAMLAATLGAIVILRSVSPTVREQPLMVGAAMLASQPLNMALLGGQTIAFTLLCVAGFYAGLRRERAIIAGVFLGLLLYKPQLAAVLFLLMAWQRRWRVLGVASIVGAALWLVGVAAAGTEWQHRFLALATSEYYRVNAAEADGIRSISLPGVFGHITGAEQFWAYGVVGVFCVGILALLLRTWRTATPNDSLFPLQFGAAVAATLLVSPHALFYEASLLIIPVLLLADHWRQMNPAGSLTRRQVRILIVLFGAGYLFPFGDAVGVQPLALLPLAVGILVWWELGVPKRIRSLEHGSVSSSQ